MGETIHRVHGYDRDAYTYYPIVIIGAGASGIAMACQLKEQLGFDQFRVFDRQSGIGGTWWINRYPGAACDIPAVFYSFSFAQNPNWTSFHPPSHEIVQYYHAVCRQYKITDKFEVNTDIDQCRWLEDEQQWEVSLKRLVPGMGDLSDKDRKKLALEKGETAVHTSTEVIRAKLVISCVGGLVEPKGWPEYIPGIENFQGKMFHAARWNETADLNDKNVVVVGTGCTSAQVVPRLPEAPYNAKSVTQLMRSPPWVSPAPVPPGGDEWWEKNSAKWLKVPGLLGALRLLIAFSNETTWFKLFPNTPYAEKQRKIYEADVLAHMKRHVPEEYHEMLTPDYGVGCKRRIFDKRWLRSLANPQISLTTQPLTRVKENSVIIGPGALYPPNAKEEDWPEKEVPADVIVLANGFETEKWLHPLRVAGRDGKDLVEEMEARGGAQAYQGTAMDGFPNFLMIFGPNTATGHSSVIMTSENMVMYSLNFIKLIVNGEASTVDVKHEAEVAFTTQLQKDNQNTVWRSGCTSWYFAENGWNSSTYPHSQIDFYRRCRFPKWDDWNINYTGKGIRKLWMTRALRVLSLAAVVLAVYRIRKRRMGMTGVKESVQTLVQSGLQRLGRLGVMLHQRALSGSG